MKKIGILAFIFAIVVGTVAAYIFSIGYSSHEEHVSKDSDYKSRVSLSGNVMTETRDLVDFKSIEVSGVFNVEIVAQKSFAVEIEADEKLLPLIKTEVNAGVLTISKKRFSVRSFKNFKAKIRISAPNIERIEASGVTKTSLSNLDGESLDIDINGASKIEVEGKVSDLNVDMNGASKLEAKNLLTKNAKIEGSGASKAYVSASDKLSCDLSGASRVNYYGDPTDIVKKTSGGSSLGQAD